MGNLYRSEFDHPAGAGFAGGLSGVFGLLNRRARSGQLRQSRPWF